MQDTGYVTLAERPPDPADYPDADPELLVPGSSVFVQPRRAVSLDDPYQWWAYVPGADWRHPRGPETSAKKLSKHPVASGSGPLTHAACKARADAAVHCLGSSSLSGRRSRCGLTPELRSAQLAAVGRA